MLTSGALMINQGVTIDASALPAGIQVNGNGSSRVFQVQYGSGSTVLNSLTITNGSDNNDSLSGGGGIYNQGNLTLTNCTVTGNTANNQFSSGFNGGGGGGIFNDVGGTLTVSASTVAGNTANNDFNTFSGGYGGGGGGIFNAQGGTLTLNECTLTGNAANNSGVGGGAVVNYGTLTVSACTVAGDSAANDQAFGGGDVGGGGGIASFSMASINNSIVASNSATAGVGGDILLNSAFLTYGGTNIVQDLYATNTASTFGPTPINATPVLAALGNYGGPTPTMPPGTGSPALGAGSVSANTFTNDQRGYARVVNGKVDIGAVEAQPVAVMLSIAYSGQTSRRVVAVSVSRLDVANQRESRNGRVGQLSWHRREQHDHQRAAQGECVLPAEESVRLARRRCRIAFFAARKSGSFALPAKWKTKRAGLHRRVLLLPFEIEGGDLPFNNAPRRRASSPRSRTP